MLCRMTSRRNLYFTLLLCLLLQACSTPVGRLTELAGQYGFEQSRERAAGFDLLVFSNRALIEQQHNTAKKAKPDVLRVYLEGDGSPWRSRVIVMPDPTPRNPLMLRLMSLDSNPAVYVGRPCYNGFSNEPDCDSSLWTSARYSESVVNSMSAGIRRLMESHGAQELWLIGHSGGGALAMLLARELPEVTRIVTLAGNLDTDAWTWHHRYTPLFSSANPAKEPALRDDIWQWHLVGGRDKIIPSQLVKPVIMAQPSASGFEFSRFNHGCCWERVWPAVLEALNTDNPRRMPAEQFKLRTAP